MSEFDKAVKHVKTCLFWDFVDGQWLEKLYTPLDRDFFNRLMQGVVETHEAESAKMRELVNSYADLFDRYAAMNNGCGPYYSGEDWLALANDMRIELAECCGELGIEMQ